VLLTYPASSRVPYCPTCYRICWGQSWTPFPMNNTNSRKPYSHSILHFTYSHQNINTHRIDTVCWDKDCSLVRVMLYNCMQSVNARCYANRKLRNFRSFTSPLHYFCMYIKGKSVLWCTSIPFVSFKLHVHLAHRMLANVSRCLRTKKGRRDTNAQTQAAALTNKHFPNAIYT
jgi:hypothetical protein